VSKKKIERVSKKKVYHCSEGRGCEYDENGICKCPDRTPPKHGGHCGTRCWGMG